MLLSGQLPLSVFLIYSLCTHSHPWTPQYIHLAISNAVYVTAFLIKNDEELYTDKLQIKWLCCTHWQMQDFRRAIVSVRLAKALILLLLSNFGTVGKQEMWTSSMKWMNLESPTVGLSACDLASYVYLSVSLLKWLHHQLYSVLQIQNMLTKFEWGLLADFQISHILCGIVRLPNCEEVVKLKFWISWFLQKPYTCQLYNKAFLCREVNCGVGVRFWDSTQSANLCYCSCCAASLSAFHRWLIYAVDDIRGTHEGILKLTVLVGM